MFTVKSHFIGSFKVGDNICYNLGILKVLYSYFDVSEESEQKLLCKPIIISLVSISEAVIYDLHYRAQHFTKEGLAGVPDRVLKHIRGAKLTDYEKHIASSRKHMLLGKNLKLYERLDELRKLRNRIHIQNSKGHFEPDEVNAFSLRRKRQAEKTTQYVLSYCSEKYPRPKGCDHVQDFELPWKRHRLLLI